MILEDMRALLRAAGLTEKVDPASFANALRKELDAEAVAIKELQALISSKPLEALSPEERRGVAAAYQKLSRSGDKAKNALSRLGSFLAMKDVVSLPVGSTGWS